MYLSTGKKAWCPDFERYSRQLGVFYSASYGENADGSEEPYFYTAYNMHWEPHTFALPNLPSGYSWHQVLDTAEDNMNGFLTEGKEKLLDDQKEALVLARSTRYLPDLNVRKEGCSPDQKAFRKQGKEKDRNKGRNKDRSRNCSKDKNKSGNKNRNKGRNEKKRS